ncbi:MAG: hypothetical protein M3N21_03075 [Actinomycetota bacterium]|nr:hypothetical protein [Actinomycetota bacterium]
MTGAAQLSWRRLVAVLALGWVLTPHAVPIYDGLGSPDEPYRLLSATLGATAAPTEATGTLRTVGGVNPGGVIVNSAEMGPQVSVYAPARAFGVPPPGADIAVSAKPVPLVSPPSGRPDSDVYEVMFVSTAGPVTLRQGAQPPTITLRAASASGAAPVMQYRSDPSASWRPLDTSKVGNDVYFAVLPGAGQFLLVQPTSHAKTGNGGSALLFVAGGVGLLVAVLVLIRFRAGQGEGAA